MILHSSVYLFCILCKSIRLAMPIVERLSEDNIIDSCTMRRQATAALMVFYFFLSLSFLYLDQTWSFLYQDWQKPPVLQCMTFEVQVCAILLRCFLKIFPKREIPDLSHLVEGCMWSLFDSVNLSIIYY